MVDCVIFSSVRIDWNSLVVADLELDFLMLLQVVFWNVNTLEATYEL